MTTDHETPVAARLSDAAIAAYIQAAEAAARRFNTGQFTTQSRTIGPALAEEVLRLRRRIGSVANALTFWEVFPGVDISADAAQAIALRLRAILDGTDDQEGHADDAE